MDRLISQKIDLALNDPATRDVILLMGMRRVGKTTELMRLKQLHPKSAYFDLEDISTRELFVPEVAKLARIIEDAEVLLLDEVQYLNKAGSVLKLLHDHFPGLRVVVTGSASFLLLRNLGDSLQGRFRQFDIFPLTFREVVGDLQSDFSVGQYDNQLKKTQIEARMEELMIFGSLPQMYSESSSEEKRERLNNYLNGLLFKDILEIEGIRNPLAFKKLLVLLALQVGSEVNPNELATILGINRRTIVEYIELFEKFQILYRVGAFSNNLRNEISRGFKVYFTDLGIRNAVITNFSPTFSRTDAGSLFENLTVNTLRENIAYFHQPFKIHFWRNTAKAEVDLVLVSQTSNEIIPIEIKLSRGTAPTKAFLNLYQSRVSRSFNINKDNYWQFI